MAAVAITIWNVEVKPINTVGMTLLYIPVLHQQINNHARACKPQQAELKITQMYIATMIMYELRKKGKCNVQIPLWEGPLVWKCTRI